jgi:hypothetical protein
MGLRSPQEMQLTKLAATPSMRLQGVQPAVVNTEFINTLSKQMAVREEARLKAEKDQLDFVKADVANTGDQLRIQAQASVANAEGINALSESKKQRDDLEAKLNKKLDLIPEKFHPYVKQEISKSLTQYDSFSVPYSYSQVKKTQDETFKTRISNDMNNAVENSADLTHLNDEGLAKVSASIIQRAQKTYGSDPGLVLSNGMTAGDMIQNEVKLGVSKTLLLSIEQQSRGDRMDIAKNILTNFNDELTPADRVKAIKILDSAEKDKGTKDAILLSSDAYKLYDGDLALASEHLRATAPNDKIFTQAMGMLKDMNFVNEKNKKRAEDDAISNIYESVQNNRGIPQDQLMKLSPEKREKIVERINTNRGLGTIVTNYDTYAEVSDMLYSMTPEEAKDFKLSRYTQEIGPQQMKTLEGLRNDLMSKAQAGKVEAQRSTIKDANDIVKEIMKQNKVIPKSAEAGKLYEMGLNEWERLKNDKNITVKELRARILTAYKQRYKTTKEVPGFLWGTTKKSVVSDTLAPDLSVVHPSVRNALRKQIMQMTGRPATLAEENMQLERLISNNVDVTTPRE